jgi:hypothetical protein
MNLWSDSEFSHSGFLHSGLLCSGKVCGAIELPWLKSDGIGPALVPEDPVSKSIPNLDLLSRYILYH